MATKTKRKLKRKQRISGPIKFALIAFAALMVLLLVAAGAIYLWLSPYRDYPYILPNVSYDGIALEGLTKEQAEQTISQNISDRVYSLNVVFNDGTSYVLTPSQRLLSDDVSEVVDAAYQYGRVSSTQPMVMYNAIRAARGASYEIPASLTLEYSKDDLRNQIDQIVSEVTIQPGSCEGITDLDAKTVTVTPGQPGQTADGDQIFDAACQAFDSLNFVPLSVSYQVVPVNLEQLTALAAALYKQQTIDVVETELTANTSEHTIQIAKGSPGYKFDQQTLIDTVVEATTAGSFDPITMDLEMVMPEDVDITLLCAAMKSDPTEVEYHDGHLTGGDPGYEADPEEAQKQYDAMDWGTTSTIEMNRIEPKHSLEEVQEVLFRDVIGRYDTNHTSDSSRTTNLRLACAEIDGIIINSGAVFSFNTFVGERTAEKGYQKAIIYTEDGEETDDGGGICQVVSTLYNAVLLADLEVTDRMTHKYLVTYVPGGLDATVYWGLQDFCFKNTTDYPIRVNASVSGGQVHISIEGTNDSGKSVRLSSVSREGDDKYIRYEGFQTVYDGDGSLIEERSLGVVEYERHSR